MPGNNLYAPPDTMGTVGPNYFTLIEQFEQNYYTPGQSSSPHSLLYFLMEQKGIKESDLIDVLSFQRLVSEVFNGKQEISKAQAKALGEVFKVEPGLFILTH